jgi:hypothetical protein
MAIFKICFFWFPDTGLTDFKKNHPNDACGQPSSIAKMAHCAIIPELFMANDALRMKVQLCKISAESEKVAQKICPTFIQNDS